MTAVPLSLLRMNQVTCTVVLQVLTLLVVLSINFDFILRLSIQFISKESPLADIVHVTGHHGRPVHITYYRILFKYSFKFVTQAILYYCRSYLVVLSQVARTHGVCLLTIYSEYYFYDSCSCTYVRTVNFNNELVVRLPFTTLLGGMALAYRHRR
jgi:hypothetical protein